MSKLKIILAILCCSGQNLLATGHRAKYAHTDLNRRLIQFITKLNRHDPLIGDRFAVPSPYQSIEFTMHDWASVTTPTVVLVCFCARLSSACLHARPGINGQNSHWVCDARIWSRYFKSNNQTHHGVHSSFGN
jgi:hypothetical protein